MTKSHKIKQILNNSTVIVDVSGIEKIFIGKGIGFGKKANDIFEPNSVVEKTFIIENKQNLDGFKQVLKGNDKDFVEFCEDLILYISQNVQVELNENIHIALTDHISYTLRRLQRKEEIVNPFLQEIELFYDKELAIAEEISKRIEKKYSIVIPRGEMGFIALHIHSAMYNGKVQDALKNNRICNKVLSMIEKEFGQEIDRKSLDCVRFLVHLRYVIERIRKCEVIDNDLATMIIEKYPTSFTIANKISRILEKELKCNEISKAEKGFLVTHIERLSNAVKINEQLL